ncbi:MAG: hypothetical protein KDB82_08125 [Planctomycetes bacterium]|nr:hypothetical protein [Planctomycetota bacterium]
MSDLRDTPDHVWQRQVQIWQSKSFEERMRLGCAADAMALSEARRLAEQRYPGDPAGLFLLLHGDSFSEPDRNRIAEAFRRHASSRAPSV